MTDAAAVQGSAERGHPNRDYAIGLARAAGGAIIFSLPLLMTMEMWFLGFYMDRARLLLFLLLNFAMLVVLSRFVGFEPTATLRDDVLDGVEAACVQLAGSRLERVDLLRREAIAARLVPVRPVDRVIREADLLAVGLPVGARSDVVADHDADEPREPKPPRDTLWLPELPLLRLLLLLLLPLLRLAMLLLLPLLLCPSLLSTPQLLLPLPLRLLLLLPPLRPLYQTRFERDGICFAP